MARQICSAAFLAMLAALLIPAKTDAYGAARFGYTHVSPYGVYHTSRTYVAGPRGVYATGHTNVGYGNPYRAAASYGVYNATAGAVQSHVYSPTYNYYNGYRYMP